MRRLSKARELKAIDGMSCAPYEDTTALDINFEYEIIVEDETTNVTSLLPALEQTLQEFLADRFQLTTIIDDTGVACREAETVLTDDNNSLDYLEIGAGDEKNPFYNDCMGPLYNSIGKGYCTPIYGHMTARYMQTDENVVSESQIISSVLKAIREAMESKILVTESLTGATFIGVSNNGRQSVLPEPLTDPKPKGISLAKELKELTGFGIAIIVLVTVAFACVLGLVALRFIPTSKAGSAKDGTIAEDCSIISGRHMEEFADETETGVMAESKETDAETAEVMV
eukprot:scaffold7766_cov48-Attheya_sp.AAC.3